MDAYIIFAILLVGFAVLIITITKLYDKRSFTVGTVKAGLIEGAHIVSNRTFRLSPFETFYHNGKMVNPQDYNVCKVDGECMATRGIFAGNLVFISKIGDDINTKKSNITKGDILYIKYEKDGVEGYKLREFSDFDTQSDKINTLYYSAEDKVKHSSKPHDICNIVGKVVMKFDYDN
ncbi:MAG: hypothetical protein R3Y26_12180 [Rikenellaceae bacterium]